MWRSFNAGLGNAFIGTVGLFLAMAGYSPESLDEVDRGGRLEVLLLDRQHFEAMLSGFAPPQELLKLVHGFAGATCLLSKGDPGPYNAATAGRLRLQGPGREGQ